MCPKWSVTGTWLETDFPPSLPKQPQYRGTSKMTAARTNLRDMPQRSKTTVKDFRYLTPVPLLWVQSVGSCKEHSSPLTPTPLYCSVHLQCVLYAVLNSTGRLRSHLHNSVPSVSDFLSELLTSSDEHAPREMGDARFSSFYTKIIFSVISCNTKGLTSNTEAFFIILFRGIKKRLGN